MEDCLENATPCTTSTVTKVSAILARSTTSIKVTSASRSARNGDVEHVETMLASRSGEIKVSSSFWHLRNMKTHYGLHLVDCLGTSRPSKRCIKVSTFSTR